MVLIENVLDLLEDVVGRLLRIDALHFMLLVVVLDHWFRLLGERLQAAYYGAHVVVNAT